MDNLKKNTTRKGESSWRLTRKNKKEMIVLIVLEKGIINCCWVARKRVPAVMVLVRNANTHSILATLVKALVCLNCKQMR